MIKKPSVDKFGRNVTTTLVVGMRTRKNASSVVSKEKSENKGREKRSTGKASFASIQYPRSSEIPHLHGDSLDASLRLPSLGSDSFGADYVSPVRTLKGTKKGIPTSFMSSTFFSGEDFINSPIAEISLSIEHSGSSEVVSGEQGLKKQKPKQGSDEDYRDEKDAYDIHGYRGIIQDR